MITLRMFSDDSGTHATSPVVVIGTLIGDVAQWRQFETEWGAELAAPLKGKKPPLKKFHLVDCNAREGEFQGYTDGEQDAVIHDFRQIIIKADLLSTSAAIDKVAWDELVVGSHQDRLGDALDHCVCHAIEETIRIAVEHPQGDNVAVVFDRGMWLPKLDRVTEPFTHPLGRPRIVSINAVAVADSYPLQGADIVATENYWHAAMWLELGDTAQPRPHLQHYLNHMLYEGFILDRPAIEGLLRDGEAKR